MSDASQRWYREVGPTADDIGLENRSKRVEEQAVRVDFL